MVVSGSDFPTPLPSFPYPAAAPDIDPDSGSQISVCFSEDWLPLVIGALQQLTLQATWQGSVSDVLTAQMRAQTLLAMFGAADGGCESGVCIDGLIYDSDSDTVRRSIDGGETYFDTPELDPRHGDGFRYPPNTAEDQKCQAAANMTRYISDLISEVILVVDTAGTAEGLVAILLPFLIELGPFGILIDLVLGLAFILFAAGATAISAAFTSGVYDQLTCIFYCNISADGTVSAAQLAQIQAQIASDIGGLVQTVLDSMFFLMGEVGLSNAGAIGDAPADCSSCDCPPSCHEWSGVGATAVDAIYTYRTFQSTLTPSVTFTRMTIDWQLNPNSGATLHDADLRIWLSGSGLPVYTQPIGTNTGEFVVNFTPPSTESAFIIQVRSYFIGGSNYPDFPLIRFEYLPDDTITWSGGSDC